MRELGDDRRLYPIDVMVECNKTKIMKYGYRLVRTPGFLIAYKMFWNSDKLKPYIGQYVVASAVDETCSEVNIYKCYPLRNSNDFICKIEKGV